MAESLTTVDDALEALEGGEPICLYDAADREAETDLVYPATAVTPETVARLRSDAGGLICVALSEAVAEAFELPFIQAALDHPATANQQLAYDERSSFSLSVNHRETRTGITDEDRALTIQTLGTAAERPEQFAFAETFRSPGHVPLLRAAPSLADRRGHTELGVALAEAAGLAPAVVVCEMLADGNGALDRAAARSYADRNGIPFVDGDAVLAALS